MAFSKKLPEKSQIFCAHQAFEGSVRVDRIADTNNYLARLEIHCADCGLPFAFDPEKVYLFTNNTVAKLAIAPSVETAIIPSLFKA